MVLEVSFQGVVNGPQSGKMHLEQNILGFGDWSLSLAKLSNLKENCITLERRRVKLWMPLYPQH